MVSFKTVFTIVLLVGIVAFVGIDNIKNTASKAKFEATKLKEDIQSNLPKNSTTEEMKRKADSEAI